MKSSSAALGLILPAEKEKKRSPIIILMLKVAKIYTKLFSCFTSVTFGLLSSSGDEGDGLL
jgi:hypothetical protein